MIIHIDTREKPSAIGKILKQFDDAGVKYSRTKLYVGDYVSLENNFYVIDRKHQHQRFKAELLRAKDEGIKVCVLVEHGGNITCLEDVKNWVNPRLKTSPKATKGETLYKILNTLTWTCDVDFEFCKKGETGNKIIELLKEHGG